jgi:hypothetical protein
VLSVAGNTANMLHKGHTIILNSYILSEHRGLYMSDWIGSAASDDLKELARDGFCPYCGAELPKVDTILGEDYQAGYLDHADSGKYRAGMWLETQNKELHKKNKQILLELIEEIGKADVHPDLKSQIVDSLKAASENPAIVAIIVACLSHYH